MPLTYSDVVSVEGALETGVMRSTGWMFHNLRDIADRMKFLRERFTSMAGTSLRALYTRMEGAFRQAQEATRSGTMPLLSELQRDPKHAAQGRIGVTVTYTGRGWVGPPGTGRPPDLFTRQTTLYYDRVPSMDQIAEDLQRVATAVREGETDPRLKSLQPTVTSVSFHIQSITRGF